MEVVQDKKIYSAKIADNFIIESSHEIVIPNAFVNKPWNENDDYIPREKTEYEKEMLKGTKTISELLEEEKNEVVKELTEEEKFEIYKKNFITMVKVIALDEIGKFPIDNPSYFSTRDKKKLMDKMSEILRRKEDDIKENFNRICNDVLFCPEANYEKYTIYKNK